MKPFFVYLLRCADASYYVGQTDDLQVRLQQHEDGQLGYTATRKPVELLWQGEFESRAEAIAFEQQIKGWSRAKKEALVQGDWARMQVLSRSRGVGANGQEAALSGQNGAPPDRLEPVEGSDQEEMTPAPLLRQAQPERVGVSGAASLATATTATTASTPSSPTSVRPEPVEGLGQAESTLAPRLRQAQPERVGVSGAASLAAATTATTATIATTASTPSSPTSVRPEPVEGLGQAETRPAPQLRQAQLERVEVSGAASLRAAEDVQAATSAPAPDSATASTPSSPTPVRPEPVEGLSPTVMVDRVEALIRPQSPMAQRRALAKAITLLESTRADHRAQGDELLTALLPHTGKAFRLGISGVPGVGKSTFIEALGLHLIAQGHRVAVLTIDPSSTVSGGSILGDKTRMEKLSVDERAYIRPSPSAGTLGGVAEKTREAMLVCEAAGYDVVIVETVGVGQSETAVANMCDMFALLQLPNAGDDLQAIKKGVMEIADLVVINKADIDKNAATRAQAQITSALRLFGHQGNPDHISAMHDAHAGEVVRFWQPQVMQLSAVTGDGVDRFWSAVCDYRRLQTANGRLALRREKQSLAWMWERIESGLKSAFRQHPGVRERLPQITTEVIAGRLPASTAARQLLAEASKSITHQRTH